MSTYENPVIRGHAPDPSAVRVGEDFYLVNSSFGFLPGLPIHHSTDLVHWTPIGFAVERPAQYRRDDRPGAVNLFAPTIRHHGGVFYIVCTNQADGEGNFLLTADDPAGPWSDARWIDREAFDPSLFRDDDGQWYYTRRSLRFDLQDGLGPIVQATIDPATGERGELRPITRGDVGFASNDIEGPHLMKRGDWYYLTAAEGSSWKGHMQTIGRSRSPWGPFEAAPANPILTHRDRVAHPVQSLGHAELIDDADGAWWALALGTRHPPFASHHTLGRETFLIPVSWPEGEWPEVGRGGHVELVVDGVVLPSGTSARAQPTPTVATAGWRTLGPRDQPLDGDPDGRRIVVPTGAALDEPLPPGAAMRAQSEYWQRLEATVTPLPGAGVGVGVYADRRHHYSVVLRLVDGETRATFRRVVDDLRSERMVVVPGAGPVRLVIEASSREYRFVARRDGDAVELGIGRARLLAAEATQWFTNVNWTLIAEEGAGDGALVAFEDVVVEDVTDHPAELFEIPA